ncbi:MAG: tryptophan 2,3-dioxygenase [Bacteroidetes bacterium]|nr:tryptophan 2,3-dioxygenase [Bacteroidota bacterium]
MKITTEIEERLKLLDEKYASSGQDLVSYLDGLLFSDYLKYWHYIELETLLSLQKPKTNFPDEEIFIIYHQITELYFKLTLNEMQSLAEKQEITATYFLDRLGRIIRYFQALIASFEVMVDGMDPKEFMKFRMALLPASGFQSVQYRKIEIHSTQIQNLVEVGKREEYKEVKDVNACYQNIYWKQGAIDLKSGKKTLTLLQFEEKYDQDLIKLAEGLNGNTILDKFNALSEEDKKNKAIQEALRKLDLSVNVFWPLAHYKSAVRYLHSKDGDVGATGGTNWQKYLPPRFQKRIFFPELWSEEEKNNWGRTWVEETLNDLNSKL